MVSLGIKTKVVIGVIAVLVFTIFVPCIPDARFTYCHYGNCVAVTQYASISYYTLCVGSIYSYSMSYVLGGCEYSSASLG